MNSNFLASLKFRILFPVSVLVVLGVMSVATLMYFHAQRIHNTDAISIVDRQSMLLEVIKTNMDAALSGNKEAIKTVETKMDVLEESLVRLRDGGIIEYGFDQIDLQPTSNPRLVANIKNMKSRWNQFEDKLRELIANYDNKSREEAGRIVVEGYHRDLLLLNDSVLGSYQNEKRGNKSLEITLFAIYGVFAFLASVLLYRNFNKFYRKPLDEIVESSLAMSKGDVSQKIRYRSRDLLGGLSLSINQIIQNIEVTSGALRKVGDGNFNINYRKKSDYDELGGAVEEMRSKLQNFFEEDKRKSAVSNWTNKGLANFADILRNNTDDITELCDKIASELTKYMEANQAAVYTIETDADGDHLNLVSTYAWKRKKHLEKRIEFGEGLIGQAVLEKDTILLTDVPDEYVEITSGLGKANPNSILIVPMKVNDEVYGVIEVASFKVFEEHEVELVDNIAESIAGSISTVRTNAHTKQLLSESQLLTEQMRAQEEELRQNTEELQATQESINQKLELIDFEKQKTTAILETCVDGVVIFNTNGSVEFFNKAAEEIWGIDRSEVVGSDISVILDIETFKEDENYVVKINVGGNKVVVGTRTEATVTKKDGELEDVLITASENRIGSEHVFSLFVQSIAVELF